MIIFEFVIVLSFVLCFISLIASFVYSYILKERANRELENINTKEKPNTVFDDLEYPENCLQTLVKQCNDAGFYLSHLNSSDSGSNGFDELIFKSVNSLFNLIFYDICFDYSSVPYRYRTNMTILLSGMNDITAKTHTINTKNVYLNNITEMINVNIENIKCQVKKASDDKLAQMALESEKLKKIEDQVYATQAKIEVNQCFK